MFTSRFTWSLDANPLSLALDARREAGLPIVDLTLANPARAGLGWSAETLGRLYAHPAATHYDPDPRGMVSARREVAAYYAAHGISVSVDSIHLTASTSEGYGWLLKLLTDPGDSVLAPAPSYPLLEFLGAMECVSVTTYPLVFCSGRWRVDEVELERAVTPRTRAIIAVNPNNPTGSGFDAEDRAALRRVAVRHGLALLVDEVFLDFPFEPNRGPASFADEAEAPVFVLSGFSKIAALPQAKLGWIVTAGAPEFREEAVRRLDYIADTYLSVNTAVQLAAPGLFAEAAFVRARIAGRCRENLTRLCEWCATSGHGVVVEPVEAGWYAVLRLPRGVDEERATLELLRREGVYAHPGHFFGYTPDEARWVVSLLPDREAWTAAFDAFDAVLRRL